MNKLYYIMLLVVVMVTINACRREYIGDYDINYIGEWHSDTLSTPSGQKEIYLIIDGENSEFGFMCDIGCTSCECQAVTSGNAVINHKHNVLIIGSGNGNKRFRLKIKTPPFQNSDGKWVCVMESSEGTEITMHKR